MNLLNDTDTFSLQPLQGPEGRTITLKLRNGTGDYYVRQDEMALGIALSIRQSPENLWENYLERGGEKFRDGLFDKYGCERVIFTDIWGYVWIKFEWAMDFCNLYNPDLKDTILTYYRRNAMGLRGSEVVREGSVPALPDAAFLARLAKHVNEGDVLVYTFLSQIDQRVTQVEVTQLDTVRHIADTDRQVEHLVQEMQEVQRAWSQYERTVRGFCENICGHKPSVKEAYDWGRDLSNRYRSKMPGDTFPKTQCRYGGQLVNYYEPQMLIDYFTERGLYKPQTQLL